MSNRVRLIPSRIAAPARIGLSTASSLNSTSALGAAPTTTQPTSSAALSSASTLAASGVSYFVAALSSSSAMTSTPSVVAIPASAVLASASTLATSATTTQPTSSAALASTSALATTPAVVVGGAPNALQSSSSLAIVGQAVVTGGVALLSRSAVAIPTTSIIPAPGTPGREVANLFPQLWDSAGTGRVAILGDAFDVILTDTFLDSSGGQETLTFSLPQTSVNGPLIQNEMNILVTVPTSPTTQQMFTVRTMTRGWNANQKVWNVTCEARWYDLGAADPIVIVPPVTGARAAMTAILAGSGWTVGNVDPASVATYQLSDYTAPLAALRALSATFGGELYFDTVGKVVHLVNVRGTTTVPKLFYAHGKNLAGNERTVDTSQLTTRLRPIGSSGLDITGVNGNVAYIEDYSYYDTRGWPRQVKTQVLTNDGLTDPNNLLSWARAQLSTLSQPKITYTFNVALARTDAMPAMGDVVRVWDKELGFTANARVIGRTLNIIEPWKSTLDINTAAYSLLAALGLLGQQQYPGSSTASSTTSVNVGKGLSPSAPLNVVGYTDDYIDANGNHATRVYATWSAVTTNSDGSPLVDFDHYESQFQRAGYTVWVPIGNTTNTGVYTEDFKVGATYAFRVRSVDTAGNASAWTTISGTVGAPNATPRPPSTPILDANTFPLCIRATWDGNDSSGFAAAPDFDHLEVHISTVNGFAPTTATLVDTQRAPAVSPITGLVAGTTYYVVFRMVNVVGQVSGNSVQASATPRQVRDGEIVSLTVSKITAGTLSADILMGARIKTADTGSRVEINSAGLYAYNSAGTNTVAIRNDGSAAFAGDISGASGNFSGSLNGANITGASGNFSGNLSGANITGASGTFSGSLSGASISGATGNFTGTLSGASITGATGTFSGTVQGATIQTAGSGTRIALGPNMTFNNNASLLAYDINGNLAVQLSPDGNQGVYLQNGTGQSYIDMRSNDATTLQIGTSSGTLHVDYTASAVLTDGAVAVGRRYTTVGEGFASGHVYTSIGLTGAWVDMVASQGGSAVLFSQGGNTRLGCASGSVIYLQNVSGSAYAAVYGGAYTNSSSITIKQDVVSLAEGDGLDLVRRMRPVRYRLKDEHEAEHLIGHVHAGFIAEEMNDILPEATPLHETDGIVGINYAAVIPVLVKAIQELEERIDKLVGASG